LDGACRSGVTVQDDAVIRYVASYGATRVKSSGTFYVRAYVKLHFRCKAAILPRQKDVDANANSLSASRAYDTGPMVWLDVLAPFL
jgi:hypothetical protein